MNISRKKLIENAGIFKEGSTDRDAIAHFVWGRDDLIDKSEDELEGLIDELEKEYNASKSNYPSVDDYLEDLEAYGAYRDYLKEGPVSEDYSTMSLKSNIDQKWQTADDMAGDMQQWLSSVYGSGGEQMYQQVMGILQNLADNFDPEDEM